MCEENQLRKSLNINEIYTLTQVYDGNGLKPQVNPTTSADNTTASCEKLHLTALKPITSMQTDILNSFLTRIGTTTNYLSMIILHTSDNEGELTS